PAGGTLVVPQVVAGIREDRAWITSIRAASDLVPPPSASSLLRERQALLPAAPVLDEVGRHRERQWHETVSEILALIRQGRSEEHTSELQSRFDLVCRLLLEKKNK